MLLNESWLPPTIVPPAVIPAAVAVVATAAAAARITATTTVSFLAVDVGVAIVVGSPHTALVQLVVGVVVLVVGHLNQDDG